MHTPEGAGALPDRLVGQDDGADESDDESRVVRDRAPVEPSWPWAWLSPSG